MSDKRTLLLVVLLAPLVGCGTTQKPSLTIVGSSTHAPYPAKPEYLGTPALPDPDSLKRGNVGAAIHVSAPPVVDTRGDDTEPGVAESAEAAEPAPQQDESSTIAPSNEAPPQIIPTINPPEDHP